MPREKPTAVISVSKCRVRGTNRWRVRRHSAASYWLADCGSAATVATALGHSDSVLKKHYMALVTKADAEKFWKL